MKKLVTKRIKLDYKDYIRRPADRKDFKDLIKEDTILYDEADKNKPLLLYFKLTEKTTAVSQACQDIPYETSARSGGLMSTSRIFGYDPATGIRKPFCSATRLAFKNPKEHKTIVNFGEKIADIYKEYLPDVYVSHEQIAIDKVRKEWRIPHSPFTSGIINKNNQLNYHFDSGNFKDVYSNMIVFKNNVAGGYLALPEFDIGLECSNNTLVMFDGQKILHGVTPIQRFTENSYRYSIVYYSLAQMWKCEEVDEELAKVRNRRKKIEGKHAKLNL